MKCPICDHEQTIGSFCSICGNKLIQPILDLGSTVAVEKIATRSRHVEPNIYVENIKKKSKLYSSYFMQQLKKPTHTYNQSEKDTGNSITSIILFTLLLTLSYFLFIKNTNLNHSLSFFSFSIEVFLLTLLMIGIVVLSLFIINHFFGLPHTFKAVISFYGGQLSPLIIGIAVSILLMIVKSFTYGNILLAICLFLAIFILPLYIITFLLTKNPIGIDPLYGTFLYIAVFTILFLLFSTIIGNTTLVGYFNNLTFFSRILPLL